MQGDKRMDPLLSALTASLNCRVPLTLSIDSVLEFHPNISIHAFLPEGAEHTCLSETETRVKVRHFVPKNVRIANKYHPRYWYSVFMSDPNLWASLPSKYVLVFQADTLVCRPIDIQIMEQKSLDYVGGPSLRYQNKLYDVKTMNLDSPSTFFMNGGIALHRKEWTLQCARFHRRSYLNEDAKWNRCRRKHVLVRDALAFGSDNGFSGCFTYNQTRICPSVVHKPWVFSTASSLEEMKGSCPRLEALETVWK